MADCVTKLLSALFPLKPTSPLPEEMKDESAEALPSTPLEGPGAELGKALEFTLKNEGGFSNHPADKGGPTNWGITQKRYSEFLGRSASAQDVKNMPRDHALKIYEKHYWNPLNLEKVSIQEVATCIFDMGVLCGTGTSAKRAQAVVGVIQDGKIGPKTLDAINECNPKFFIEDFADLSKQYFQSIVNRNSSQKAFLKGWLARAQRLKALASKVGDPEKDETPKDDTAGLGLYVIAQKFDLPIQAITKLLEHVQPKSSPRYWAIAELSQKRSDTFRLHLIDRVKSNVEQFLVTHGSGSDPDHDGFATKFSNVPGTHASSLGVYRCSETYKGTHGLSMRLDGLEETNSNARKRAIVMHPANYASARYVIANGLPGRSQGCLAVDPDVSEYLIKCLQNGSLLVVI
jgi:lysozyme family protein